jgi:hypothetical protein
VWFCGLYDSNFSNVKNLSYLQKSAILTVFFVSCLFLIGLIDVGFSQKSKHVAGNKSDLNLVVTD